MSAWRVHDRHIDFLVSAILASDGLVVDLPRDGDGRVDPTAIGRELLEENYASVDYCYREHVARPNYTYTPLVLPDLTTVAGLNYARNAVDSYDYQSCEHPAWNNCRARAWVRPLAEMLTAALEVRGAPEFSSIAGWSIGPDYTPNDAAEDIASP